MIGFSGAVTPGGLDLVVDEDGSSLANFTTAGGSWSSNGTEIEWETSGGGSGVTGTAILAGFPLAPIAAIEVDVRLGNSSGYAGFDFVGPNGVGLGRRVYVSAADYFYRTRSLGLSLSSATWYTIRVEKVGDATRFLLDGTLEYRTSAPGSVGVSLWAFMPALSSNVGNPHKFRNLKAWTAPVAR